MSDLLSPQQRVEVTRKMLAEQFFGDLLDRPGVTQKELETTIYMAKLFPDVILDITRYLSEEAINAARQDIDQELIIKNQLRPYFAFNLLLGKCPQVTALMYSYFENSSFHPFPPNLFTKQDDSITYTYTGFNDDLVKKILIAFLKYLIFNPNWFSSIWNWGELGRLVTIHTNSDIKYLAACCLSIITKPTRPQHMAIMRETMGQELIYQQITHRSIFDNTFKPCIETKTEKRDQHLQIFGVNLDTYEYCENTFAKIANVLLIKSDIQLEGPSLTQYEDIVDNFIVVPSLIDSMSKIAYCVSINKPCLIRGTSGSGKTAILDYIAANTYRLNPPEYIKIQVGDQVDSKLLIGSYMSTEVPGQFEWLPGPLTRAMAYGSWIVFEDIDTAPSDMAQVIHSVIENGNLSCIASCPIKLSNPHPDFRIFFTQRVSDSKSSNTNVKLGFGFVERLCDIVELQDFNDLELTEILRKKYNFNHLSESIVNVFRKTQKLMTDIKIAQGTRTISHRDLFKFCQRVASRKENSDRDKISTSSLECIYLDAIDCLLSSLPASHFLDPANDLGQLLNLPVNEVQRLTQKRSLQVRDDSSKFRVGRAELKLFSNDSDSHSTRSNIALTKQSLQLLEKLSLCVKYREPVLLVGETGVGKTSLVQYLAAKLKSKLTVVNLSHQSDSSDLLGDYKPVEASKVMSKLNEKFENLFHKTFDGSSNRTFLDHISNCYVKGKKDSEWGLYLKLICKVCLKALDKGVRDSILSQWIDLRKRVMRLLRRLSNNRECPMALSFSEGSLLTAVKNGEWLLLDEVNLAEPEVLQCLILILDSIRSGNLYNFSVSEDEKPIEIHENFRLFACMNPSTDIGKRNLATGTRSRFTEFFVDETTDITELRMIVESYVKACLTPVQIDKITKFYLEIKARKETLSDISGNSPVHSLRTLCRALTICANNVCANTDKSFFESLRITFLQQLNEPSTITVMQLIQQIIYDKKTFASVKDAVISKPKDNYSYRNVEGFWIRTGKETFVEDNKYILTTSVTKNLQSLARIVSLSQGKLPILIQGNTSVGKTSLIMHMAKITGNRCYRINNHEHTDLQEYVGRYVFKETGKLAFQEGLLVTAMKKGYWIILDELNLAPSELLEALNRVLDDNRELFIPETKELVSASSRFVLFATQNPPEEYAGRKLLSRAFRNRFIELHFDEIPRVELEIILAQKCELPPQYAKKIVQVMRKLQLLRRESGCFNGKTGFMTLRDLFRWGERYALFKKNIRDDQFFDWESHVAAEGLILLEGRVRTKQEAEIVKTTIEKVFNKTLDRNLVYKHECSTSEFPIDFRHIHFSSDFQKLYVQLSRALHYNEPVLLCGQTGCGKTTACQLYAAMNNLELLTYNCHLNTESSDFIGGVRPSRVDENSSSRSKTKQTFPWIDGPLVEAMKSGSIFLMDEISLADDAVLERINSALESTRSITLTEKDGEEIKAAAKFRLVATMNPGGDYGKKELSPALRNRFTEIYCYNTTNIDDLKEIIKACLSPALLKPKISIPLLQIASSFLQTYYKDDENISIRDVLNWFAFIKKTTRIDQPRPLSLQESIMNGGSMVFLDQFGTCGHKSIVTNADVDLKKSLKRDLAVLIMSKFGKEPFYVEPLSSDIDIKNDVIKFLKFCVTIGPNPVNPEQVRREFILDTPVVKKNIMKLVRAIQLDKPILLEGDPGAGKTSAVSALAKLTGHTLVRINLSEQTDISDLFGSDLPDIGDDNSGNPSFSWHDGPMLKAIKDSSWILLDEMNLASQSVLEGLNACFDHRGEIFISELNKKFIVDRNSTRIFACQNPYSQGASRKGLPQSFLNRFTSIYVEPHSSEDLVAIIAKLYPILPKDLIEKLVSFNTVISKTFNFSGFEFNLRDLLHWCTLIIQCVTSVEFKEKKMFRPDKFVQFVYLDRMRSLEDKSEASNIFKEIFDVEVYEPPYRDIKVGERSLFICRSILARKIRPPPQLPDLCILKYQLPYLESIAKAMEHSKMAIIVGESGSGKRSMVKILSALTGNKLNVICANEEMDTIELLGTYEQRSLQRDMVDLIEESKDLVNSIINNITEKRSAELWTHLFTQMWGVLYSVSDREMKRSDGQIMDNYCYNLVRLRELIEKLQTAASKGFSQKCKTLCIKVDGLMARASFSRNSSNTTGTFEWVDSTLIRSIREGSWVMIENANLLNPATLDRLNSLVEINGTISLNEKGSDLQGNIEILKPHQDFRLILTMDPEHGELSRAMRNRGTEIYVRTRFYFEDFLMLLDQNGFEPNEGRSCMTYCVMKTSCKFHKKVTNEEPAEDGSFLGHFGLNYLSKLTHEVRRSQSIDNVLFDLLVSCYKQRGFIEECSDPELRGYIMQKLEKLKKKYVVNIHDELYLWRQFRHNLLSLTGGEAEVAMSERESQILYYDFSRSMKEHVLKADEQVVYDDIVVNCIKIKIFLEHASYSDFDYRKVFIKEFLASERNSNMEEAQNIYTKQLKLLDDENVPWIEGCVPRLELAPALEWSIDSRNSPDLHYYLLALDYKKVKIHEENQNKWILSLYRIMLRMIVDLIEERTTSEMKSLWLLSEQCRIDKTPRENLIRPIVGIASELCELLEGMLNVVSNRCYPDNMVGKLLPKLFWISYLMCRLKRGLSQEDLIATCNQLPMLWALTYQKVISPISVECNISDIVFKNKKFSKRILDISQALKVTLYKPSTEEKKFYKKIANSYAGSTKICDTISKETEKLFNTMLAKYTSKSQSMTIDPEKKNLDTLMGSGLVWTNSAYMQTFYRIHQRLLSVDIAIKHSDNTAIAEMKYDQVYSEDAKNLLEAKQNEYNDHEGYLKDETYRSKCININRVRLALDQYSPIWQFKLVLPKLTRMVPSEFDPKVQGSWLSNVLLFINGLIISPTYYGVLIRYIQTLANQEKSEISDDLNIVEKRKKDHLNMYTVYLAEYLNEAITSEHQIVGWTKLRTTTSDLASLSPLIPEYSPIVSLVASYCLDISHLKLSSHSESTSQLECMIKYLWRDYSRLKLDSDKNIHDLKLAQNLCHMRCDLYGAEELVGSYKCDKNNCQCIEEYIKKRDPKLSQVLETLSSNLNQEDFEIFSKALKLIEFGKNNYLEYAPIFMMDPSVRAREKLEVYKSELAHTKLELHFKNYLYYWKTGENLQLNELEKQEDYALYPFSMRVFVERRVKLENSINRLQLEHTKRPKTDDGSQYEELRKEIDINMSHYTHCINWLIEELARYISAKKGTKAPRFNNLVAKCRMTIRNLEKTIFIFKGKYSLYSDLTTNFITGLSFVLQGLRCLYARLEQKMQIEKLNYNCSIKQFRDEIHRIFSLNKLSQGNIESVCDKLQLYSQLSKLCPSDVGHKMQSILLRTVLIQLNHHIIITPSDIPRCFPIVRKISDSFNNAWMKYKERLENIRREKEEKFQYKTSSTTLGNEISLEKQEFIEICTNFPTYNHIFQKFFESTLTSADLENLVTERDLNAVNTQLDLSMCIDICRAHYKFIKEASQNLLGQVNSNDTNENLPSIDFSEISCLEAQLLYSITRYCIPALDRNFDSAGIECHLLQANKLYELLKRKNYNDTKSSLEILDESVYDIYHDPNPFEALRFQKFLCRLGSKIGDLRLIKAHDNSITIKTILELIGRISSFLLTDPLMKFVTGSHVLLEKIDEWNRQQNIDKQYKLYAECDILIDLIKEWRSIEVQSWRNCLHRVKRNYVDSALCDLWFILYQAFNDPILQIRNYIRGVIGNDSFFFDEECFKANFYSGFASYITEFLEASTFGDYQIRLDLVFSFAIQMRFASLFHEARPNYQMNKELSEMEKRLVIDFDKLMLYVYNTYIQYKGLLEPVKEILERDEKEFTQTLKTEITIVNWQGRNLWDIKNNFRISHRKLNKVMNKYKEVLSKHIDLSSANLGTINEITKEISEGNEISESQKLNNSLSTTQSLIEQIQISSKSVVYNSLSSLTNVNKTANVMKNLHKTISKQMANRFIKKLVLIEENLLFNRDALTKFNNHKVESVILMPKDTKEVREEKQKLCRQMYNSKKFLLQSIFKNLNDLGVRYQRGLNSRSYYESSVVQLEPLRGMIQKQKQSVLASASKIVNDELINSCNIEFKKLITNNMNLNVVQKADTLSSEECQRLEGYSLDMSLDAIKHMKISAHVYRLLIELQSPLIRVTKLKENLDSRKTSTNNALILYNFKKVHKSVCLFNDLVSRGFLAISKLNELSKCYRPIDDERIQEENQAGVTSESTELDLMINDIEENNSLMTNSQLNIFKSNIDDARRNICQISYKLRDMLNNTSRNYLYSDDDIDSLLKLYQQFYKSLNQLIPARSNKYPNMNPQTVLGSLKSLIDEVEQKLKPKLSRVYFANCDKENLESTTTNQSIMDLSQCKNFKRLDLRLKKLLKQIRLSMQEIYHEELSHSDEDTKDQFMTNKLKRALMPFNYIDSVQINSTLKLDRIVNYLGDCFMTMNISEDSIDVKPLVDSLTPVLFIYSQQVASYLNVILTSIKIKLENSNQLMAFFTDVKRRGFGLPNLMQPDDAQAGKAQPSKASEDNVGFGEGAGETDASKKLEFESQLDDLKQNGDDNSEQNKQEESVEAHDDGIEMSTDVDAKAEGPEDDPSNKEEQEDSQDDDEHDMSQLDKELDTVDDSQAKLLEKLWDEKDEELEDDDKQDLRDAEMESDVKPKKEETQMKAKDDQLKKDSDEQSESEAIDDKAKIAQNDPMNASQEVPEESEKVDEVVDKKDVIQELGDHGDQPDELDLNAEATLAEKEAEQTADVDKQKEDNLQDVDMSIDQNTFEDISDGPVDMNDDEQDLEKDETKTSQQEKLSEGELESLSSIDEADLHNQLEAAVQNENQPNEEVDPSNVGDGGDTDANRENGKQNQMSAADELERREKIGNNTIYNVYPKEDDKDLEYGDDIEEIKISNLQDEQEEVEGEEKFEDAISHHEDENVSEETKSSKRPLCAGEDEEEDGRDLKRQKIRNNDDEQEDHENKDDEEVDDRIDKSGPVKHANPNSSNVYEVVDLVSSDDENPECLKNDIQVEQEIPDKPENVMDQIDNELKKRPTAQEHDCLDTDKLTNLWIDCTRQTGHLVHQLCQQLQIVLQPTKMAKYKGDYKTGKRLNMRKIVSYIASYYMKDKIWLRRTKPSKRTYNIMIAIDNSSSMHENNCRQMTYQSLALLAKSLSLIEAGSLSVVKFGSEFKCIHEFGQPYMDAIGAQWLRELRFDDSKTSYTSLLKDSCDSFAKQSMDNSSLTSPVSQLLIIISDGRNVSSEEEEVKMYLKQLKSMRVLTLVVIIDDLKNNEGKSIVDVMRTVGMGPNLTMVSYMELFPFPFYVILRRLDLMPSVLGDALRQWFELVSSGSS